MMIKTPRTLLILAALGLAGVGLAGCGFTPLYAAPGVTPKLAAIDVARPDGRTGFLMGQFLDDDFARDRSQPVLYRLTLKNSEIRIPRGIRVNNVASRYEVHLTSIYYLTDARTHKLITQGLVNVSITYDSADQPYAGIAAEEEGQRRAAEQAALRIRLELASFFASPRPLTPGLQVAGASDASLATYSERLQPSAVQSPRERAMGQPTAQGAAPDVFGLPTLGTTPEPQTPGMTTAAPAGPGDPLEDPYGKRAPPLAPADTTAPPALGAQ